MLGGWLASGVAGSRVMVIDPAPKHAMAKLFADNGIRHEKMPPAGPVARVLFIAVKPQAIAGALPALRSLKNEETVVVSIAAGTPNSALEAGLGPGAVVRAMPNTPALLRRGITAAVPNGEVSEEQRGEVDTLLKATGPVEWLDDEALIDAVTAVSGSGPAYVFFLVESLAEAGRAAGLPDDLAMRLARATVSGAGEMLHRSDETAEALRMNVTSPGGTTEAALSVLLAKDGMKPLLTRAVAAAKRRARELADRA
jgi:pyrroline-5-carboxylate reductase